MGSTPILDPLGCLLRIRVLVARESSTADR